VCALTWQRNSCRSHQLGPDKGLAQSVFDRVRRVCSSPKDRRAHFRMSQCDRTVLPCGLLCMYIGTTLCQTCCIGCCLMSVLHSTYNGHQPGARHIAETEVRRRDPRVRQRSLRCIMSRQVETPWLVAESELWRGRSRSP